MSYATFTPSGGGQQPAPFQQGAGFQQQPGMQQPIYQQPGMQQPIYQQPGMQQPMYRPHVQQMQPQMQRPPVQQQPISKNIFDNDILIFSKFCRYSQSIMQALEKYPKLKFHKICIDRSRETGQRPVIFAKIQQMMQKRIEDVPTIIAQRGQYIFCGRQAFKYIAYKLNPSKSGISGFNEKEMNEFSDDYMIFGKEEERYGSSNINDLGDNLPKLFDATEQSFAFVDKQLPKITTPYDHDDQRGGSDMERNFTRRMNDYRPQDQDSRRDIGNAFFKDQINQNQFVNDQEQKRYQNLRNQGVPQYGNGPRPADVDFTNPNIGYSGMVGANFDDGFDFDFESGGGQGYGQGFGNGQGQGQGHRQSTKERELNSRYEQMMLERKMDALPTVSQRPTVDWTAGTITY